MSLANVLSSRGYFIVNKTLCKKLGLTSAAIIGEMYAKYAYLKHNDKLVDGEYFYYTREDLRDNLGITMYEQRKVINTLIKMGILSTKLIGLPAVIHYKIDENKLAEVLEITEPKTTTDSIKKADDSGVSPRCENIEHQGFTKTEPLDLTNSTTQGFTKTEPNNTIYNNTKTNNTDISISTIRNTKSISHSTNGTAKNAAPKTLTTKKSKKAKNDYGDMFFRISDEFGFSETVTSALEKFGNVLVTAKAHCTPEGVRGQLTALSDNVKNDKDRIEIINRAIACGHTTLIYSIENYTRTKGFNKAGRPSWESDKLKSGPTEEEIRARNERIARGEVEWF